MYITFFPLIAKNNILNKDNIQHFDLIIKIEKKNRQLYTVKEKLKSSKTYFDLITRYKNVKVPCVIKTP